jgi:branched-subunit amino acid transport protein
MTWPAILALAAGSYGLKAMGLLGLGGRVLPDRVRSAFTLIPAALLSALVAVQTFGDGRHLTIDARAAGFVAAAIVLLAKRGFLAVIVAGAAATAIVRAM